MTIWLIGFMFCLGIILDDDEEKLSIWYTICLILIWPMVLGSVLRELVGGKDDS